VPVTAKPSFVQAMFALYASVNGPPAMYLDEWPENQTPAYPRAIFEHGGERPVPGSYDATGRPIESVATGTIRITGENDSDAVEALARLVLDAFTATALQLTFDVSPRLFRREYTLRGLGFRSPAGKPLYEAAITYEAMFSTPY
jgi:hypothetical protein